MGAVSFSRIFGFVANGTDGGQLHRLFVAISSIGFLQHVPWLLKLHNLLMPLTGNLVGLNDRHGHFYDMSDAEVEAWKRRAHEQKDMVATLVDVQNAKPGQLSDQDLKYMMNTNIFAGKLYPDSMRSGHGRALAETSTWDIDGGKQAPTRRRLLSGARC